MVLYSASRRTDIVAFFPDAAAAKINRSRKLDGIVFWTKDPRNLLNHHGLQTIVTRYPSIVQLTATGLAGGKWEPHVPPAGNFAAHLMDLAKMLPRGAIRWRFDPIIPEDGLWSRFTDVVELASQTMGGVDELTVSFADPYRHAVDRSTSHGLVWPRPGLREKRSIIEEMVARLRSVTSNPTAQVRLCCEPGLAGIEGTTPARCIDGELFDRLYDTDLSHLEKDRGQRTTCGCIQSVDIGAYDMICGHKCRYCYANRDAT